MAMPSVTCLPDFTDLSLARMQIAFQLTMIMTLRPSTSEEKLANVNLNIVASSVIAAFDFEQRREVTQLEGIAKVKGRKF